MGYLCKKKHFENNKGLIYQYQNMYKENSFTHLPTYMHTINRPIFCGVRNRGIAPARHWKNFSWKIIHIYVVVVFREKKFFFQVILYSKNGDSESVLLKESFYTGMTSGQISYIVEVTRPEKLIRHIPWDVLPRRWNLQLFILKIIWVRKIFYFL